MAVNTTKYLPFGFGLLFVICAAFSLFVMFKAGCAGDLKGGSLGDPVRALQLEGFSLFPLLFSAASNGSAIGLMSKSIHRVAQGLAFAIFVLFCLWMAGMQAETWGVQSCF
ncbi:MAG: hypothetical protein Q8K62_09765 [Thiobacillus sp.]|nr:hypothetical protein [Thiobacillus sp.]